MLYPIFLLSRTSVCIIYSVLHFVNKKERYFQNIFKYLKISFFSFIIFCTYSVLSAITGSFLDAALAGIIPPINVSITLNTINVAAFANVSVALSGIFPA